MLISMQKTTQDKEKLLLTLTEDNPGKEQLEHRGLLPYVLEVTELGALPQLPKTTTKIITIIRIRSQPTPGAIAIYLSIVFYCYYCYVFVCCFASRACVCSCLCFFWNCWRETRMNSPNQICSS